MYGAWISTQLVKLSASHKISHLSFGEWRYGKKKKFGRYASLQYDVMHLYRTSNSTTVNIRKEKGTMVYLNALSRIRLEKPEKHIKTGERCLNIFFHTSLLPIR
jgi:hypothetical protein